MSAVSLINKFGKQTRVERPSYSHDTGGGQVQTFGLVATEKVWIQPTSANNVRQYGAEYEDQTHDGFVRVGAPIRHGDELEQAGQRYKVLGRFNAGNVTLGSIAHQQLALAFTTGVT